MSAFQVGGELSRTIGPLVVLCAISLWKLEGIYRLIPLGIVTSWFLYRAAKNNTPPDAARGPAPPRGRVRQTLLGTKYLFTAVFGILLTKSFSASVLAAFLPVLLTGEGRSLWLSGSALSLLQASAIAGVFLSGTLSDRLGCKKMLFALTLATPLVMFLFIYASGWLAVISLVLLGLTAFSSTPVVLSLIQQQQAAHPATANGIYMAINFVLSSLTVMFAGVLSDKFGMAATVRICAVCSCAGVPFLFVLNRALADVPFVNKR